MLRRILLMSIACVLIFGCNQTNPHREDPFEGLNRATFRFNKVVDTAFAKPIAYVYLKYLPSPFQLAIGNFFDNLREIPNVANDILQFKFAFAAHDTSRFLINSTVGIFGLFDPASTLGLEHRKEDFGQTLYHWGYKSSSYLVLPLLGPSTFRDAIGLTVDYYAFTVWPWIDSDWKYAFLALDFIDLRARLLRKESVLDALAVDEYSFVRDAYLQHRKFLFTDSLGETEDDIYGDFDGVETQSKKEEKTAPDTSEKNASDTDMTIQNGNEVKSGVKNEIKAQNQTSSVKNEIKKDLRAESLKKNAGNAQAQSPQNSKITKVKLNVSKMLLPTATSASSTENTKAQDALSQDVKQKSSEAIKPPLQN